MPDQPAASWYRDPYGRHELRYWDGRQWTEHVVSRGSQGVDPPVASPHEPAVRAASIRTPRTKGVVDSDVIDASLFTSPFLVVAQRPKLFEVKVGYAVRDEHGKRIGTVREAPQDAVRRHLSPRSDSRRRRVLQVVDTEGRVRLVLTRGSTLLLSKMIVHGRGGAEIGRILQKNIGLYKIRFSIVSKGELLGTITGKAWDSSSLTIRDAAGNEIGRIGKMPSGIVKQLFMKGEDYFLQVYRQQAEPLRSLLVASPLAVDAALRQDAPLWEQMREERQQRYSIV